MRKGITIHFDEKQKRQILALRGIGLTYLEIAKRFNVSDNFISQKIKQWSNLQKD